MARFPRLVLVALSAALFVVSSPLNVASAVSADGLATWSSATVQLPANDVAYDATRDVLLVTVPATHTSLGNSLVELDPETGALGRHAFVGSQPTRVVVTDDGTTAFVGLDGANAITQVDLATFSVEQRIAIALDPNGGPLTVEDLDVLPGRNDAVVASVRTLSHKGVWAFVDGQQLPLSVNGPNRITTVSPTAIFGFQNNISSYHHFALGVTEDGVTGGPGAEGPISGSRVDVEFALGRVYSTNGLIFDPVTFEPSASFAANGLLEVTPDGRITVVNVASRLVSTFDAATGAPLESRTITGIPDSTALVASSSGFALAGPSGVTLLGPQVAASAYLAPPAPPTQLEVLDRLVLPYRVNDLVFDAGRDLLYASVRTGSTARPDELLAIDPDSGEVVRSLWLGSNPSRMAMAADGSLLHVGLDTIGRVATVDLGSFTSTGSFALALSPTPMLFAEDLEVRPGTTDELVVSLMTVSSPQHQGVALYVDGVRSSLSTPVHTGANRIEFFDEDTIYGVNNSSSENGLYHQEVTDAGVETVSLAKGLFAGSAADIEMRDGLLYSWSRIFDPTIPAVLGSLPMYGPAHVDPVAPRIYVAERTGGNRLMEVDRDTLRVVGTTTTGTNGMPTELLSTRTDQGLRLALAVRLGSSTGQLILFTPAPGRFHPVEPSRIVDTRSGLGAPSGRITAGASVAVDVTGVGGVPADGVDAVVVNLTSVGATTAGYLTAWATGLPKPGTSNLNFRAGQVVANQAIVPVGADGTISVANSAGATHVIADVQGWFGDGSEEGGSRLNPVAPARVGDSRSGDGVPAGRVAGGATVELDVTGVGGVPASGASAVVVNVTAVGALASTHLTLWGSGGPKPSTSNVNVAGGQVVANQAIVPIGANGRISIANAAGATHVILDVQGWFGDDGALLQPVTPARLADSRIGVGVPTGKVPAGGTVTVDVTGVGGVPATGAVAVVVNLTVTGATASSHLTAWPSGQPKPSTSNVNFGAGQVVANQAIIPVGADGTISIANAAGATHVVVDVQGWFGPTG